METTDTVKKVLTYPEDFDRIKEAVATGSSYDDLVRVFEGEGYTLSGSRKLNTRAAGISVFMRKNGFIKKKQGAALRNPKTRAIIGATTATSRPRGPVGTSEMAIRSSSRTAASEAPVYGSGEELSETELQDQLDSITALVASNLATDRKLYLIRRVVR